MFGRKGKRNPSFGEDADLTGSTLKRKVTVLGIPVGRFIFGCIAAVAVLVLVAGAGNMVENLDNSQVMVIQDPVDGELHVYTSPGLKFQKWGKVTKYTKSFPFWFSAAPCICICPEWDCVSP